MGFGKGISPELLFFLLFSLATGSLAGCGDHDQKETPSSFTLDYFPNPAFYQSTEKGVSLLYPPDDEAFYNFLGMRIRWRSAYAEYDGFSPLQPVLLKTSTECPSLPQPGEEEWSVSSTSPVILWDDGTKERIPWFGEAGEDPAYCVLYPLKGFSSHGKAYVGVTPSFGAPLKASGVLAEPPPELSSFTFTLLFSFPVGSIRERTSLLFAIREKALRWIEDHLGSLLISIQENPPEDFVQDYPGKLLAVKGKYRVPWFLGEDGRVALDPNTHKPFITGEFEEQFFLIIPATVTQETVIPLVQYGHGLFGDPREIWYGDQRNLIRIVGGVFGAVPWGMAIRYFHRAGVAILDPTEIFLLRDMVFQGMVNQIVFTALFKTELARWVSDQLGRPVSGEVDYIGISQGGILGGVLLSLDPWLRRGVLHVGGGGWTAMMTHSSNWKRQEGFGYGDAVKTTIPNPTFRTALYAIWQSIWDQWDPAIYAHYWHTPPEPGFAPPHPQRSIYYPYAIADPQVPNFASETVLRSAGIPLLTPSITRPYGVAITSYPGSFTQVAGQWDVGPGEPAHSEPRKLLPFGRAVREFIRTGVLSDPCEGRPCRFRLEPEPELLSY